MRIWLYLYQATAFGNETVAAMILLVAPTHQRTALHRDRHRAGWIQRRERVDRAGYLAAARHSFAVRFGFRRFRNYARPVGPKKLHLQSSGADAFRPDDRRGKSPFASVGATDKCDPTGRQRRFPRATNSNAGTIRPKHATGG